MRRHILGWLVAAAAIPAVAAAEPVQLTLQSGRVSLVATDVTVGQILDEWARIGGTRIVNAERVPGGRVTLQLADVPEREALDLLLRSAAGYVAAQRPEGSEAASRFALILILPTSVAPSASAQATASASVGPRTQGNPAMHVLAPSGALRVIGPDGEPVPDDQEGAPEPPQPYVPLPPGFAEPSSIELPPEETPAPPTTSAPAVGAPVPGMIVPPPVAVPAMPREVRPIVVQPQP
jgi:hypothetical protein